MGQALVMGDRTLTQGFGQLLMPAAHGIDSGNYTCTATREEEMVSASTQVVITGKKCA